MREYVYTAINQEGEKIKGTLKAINKNELKKQLYKKKYTILSIKEKKNRKINFQSINASLENVKLKDKVLFSRQFAILLDTKVQLNEALNHLLDNTTNYKFKKAIAEIKKDVESGMQLSEAMRKHSKIFSPLYVYMIESGEQSGNLSLVMNTLADDLEREADIKKKFKGAMVQPTILLIATIITVFVLMKYVIPSFVSFFDDMGAELPFLTRWLIIASNFTAKYWYVVFLIIVGIIFGISLFYKTSKGKYIIDKIKLKLPIFGKLFTKMAVLRMIRTLRNLQISAVPLMESLEIVGQTSGNAVIERALINVREKVRQGEKLNVAMKANAVFPPLVIKMITIGEESGDLPAVLGKIVEYYQSEVEDMLNKLVELVNPLATAILGGIIGIVAIAILWPSWSLLDVMRNAM